MAPVKLPPLRPESTLWRDKSRRGSYSQVIDSNRRALLLILIDQSYRYVSRSARGAEAVANEISTLVNSCIETFAIRACRADGPVRDRGLDIGVFGYHTDAQGNTRVQPAFAGELAGRDLASISELAQSPARIKTMTTLFPDEASDELIEMPMQLPVWVEPVSEGAAPMCAAISKACRIVDGWIPRFPQSFPPIVWNISSGSFSDGRPWPYAQSLMQRSTTDGHVLLFHTYVAHLPCQLLFPTDEREMPDAASRTLFESASILPQPLAAWLGRHNADCFNARIGARCVSINADFISHFIQGEILEFDDSRAWWSSRAGWLESQAQ